MKKEEIIYGIHAVHSVLCARPFDVIQLWLQANRNDKKIHEIKSLAKKHNIFYKEISSVDLQKLAGEDARHQGVVLSARATPEWSEEKLMQYIKNSNQRIVLLVLDGVQDPHNLGACLRSANAFGVVAVIAPKDRAASLTDTAKKAACGAAEHTPFITVTNLQRTLQQLQTLGIWFVGLDADASLCLNEIDLKRNIGIVMGGEGSGLRRLTREQCDFLAKIPMQGSVSSLNVSVATGIVLYELQKPRISG